LRLIPEVQIPPWDDAVTQSALDAFADKPLFDLADRRAI